MARLVIITDLDGTLLDQRDYSYNVSLAAVHKLRSLNIPLILCSSKTRAEILPLWRELNLADPFIAENGALICIPRRYFPGALWGVVHESDFDILPLGTPVGRLRRALAQAARECHLTVASFENMDVWEISTLTGLTLDKAALAKEREYDEPFLIDKDNSEHLLRLLRAKGFRITRGDYFFHITGDHDKGMAVDALVDLYRQVDVRVKSVGLGNSANDLELLSQVDLPFLVRNLDGSYNFEITSRLSAIRRTQGIGPEGWREAIETVLREVEL